jgi:hypothetical protein
MKIKTSELTGAALDWAVAKCEGHTDGKDFAWYYDRRNTFNFSTNWAQGGPIIEREKITLRIWDDEDYVHAYIDTGKDWFEGPTPLIAAMRCYVASKLGDNIDIPEELT